MQAQSCSGAGTDAGRRAGGVDDPARDAAVLLRRIAEAEADLAGVKAEAARESLAVQKRFSRRVLRLEGRANDLRSRLEGLLRRHRGSVLPRGRKTLSTRFGEAGFRKSGAVLRVRDDAPTVCARLRAAGRDGMVRVTESVDKAAVKRAVRRGALTPEELERCGLALEQRPESFFCRVRSEASADRGGAGR